jgi:hypothetical protein
VNPIRLRFCFELGDDGRGRRRACWASWAVAPRAERGKAGTGRAPRLGAGRFGWAALGCAGVRGKGVAAGPGSVFGRVSAHSQNSI